VLIECCPKRNSASYSIVHRWCQHPGSDSQILLSSSRTPSTSCQSWNNNRIMGFSYLGRIKILLANYKVGDVRFCDTLFALDSLSGFGRRWHWFLCAERYCSDTWLMSARSGPCGDSMRSLLLIWFPVQCAFCSSFTSQVIISRNYQRVGRMLK
jgi:hypothetical protein